MTLTVNGVTLASELIEREAQLYAQAQDPSDAARRSLAVRQLLLQRAHELGFNEAGDATDREKEDAMIAQVLDAEVATPMPTEAECRRHYDTHREPFTSGKLIEARHILIAVTPGAPLALLRTQAESLLMSVQSEPSRFAELALEASNCPSGQHGGNLGQFGRGQMVPEFDKALFGTTAIGVLPQLVQTRYGFHIVLVERRLPGRRLDFETVHQGIAEFLASRVQSQALMQYVRLLAGKADIDGVDLDGAASPLLQ